MASGLLNDVHSRMNPTRVAEVVRPRGLGALVAAVRGAGDRRVSISGSRHAMGGQQFGGGTLHLDTRGLDRLLAFDAERGLARIEAGAQWPTVIAAIRRADAAGRWGIRQKQTGASDLTLGGAVSANIHGRGLKMAPFVSDVEALTLVRADGEVVTCSRVENAELFRLAVGGYGLFGVVADVTLRLSRRRKVRRCVDEARTDEIAQRFDEEAERGTLYGDYQFAIDDESPNFLQRGIFSRYRPVEDDTPIPEAQRRFTPELWLELLRLARMDRSEAFRRYLAFYKSTDGQVYHTDTHQLSTYVPRYHDLITDLPAEAQGVEVISELYVPRECLARFMKEAAERIRSRGARVTYGTVRVIERDEETYLPWARRAYACVIFNLLTPETEAGRARTAGAFRDLIDVALEMGGSFYLTYHRWARADQVERAYPEMRAFLARKLEIDSAERFVSEWYRSMKMLMCSTQPARASVNQPM